MTDIMEELRKIANYQTSVKKSLSKQDIFAYTGNGTDIKFYYKN